MTGNEANVCIVIAAFQAEDGVARAVRSALAQARVSEVVVVDDASSDETSKVARYADDGSGRLSVITLERNAGPAHARNVALDNSSAPFLCILDADDYMMSGRIDRLLAMAPSDWDLVADDIVIVPKLLEDRHVTLTHSGEPAYERLELAEFVAGNLTRRRRRRGQLGFLKPIMRRAFLQQHNLRYDDTLRLGEDFALYTQALACGARFYVTAACGYCAVAHSGSISSLHSAADLERLLAFSTQLLAETQLAGQDRAALKSHARDTRNRYYHRVMLDRRRTHGVLRGLGYLTRVPRSLPYIASETIRAKAAGYLHRDAYAIDDKPRLLIGLGGVKLELQAENAP